MMSEIQTLVRVVADMDAFSRSKLVMEFPELAHVVACIIEGHTEEDAPKEWWPGEP